MRELVILIFGFLVCAVWAQNRGSVRYIPETSDYEGERIQRVPSERDTSPRRQRTEIVDKEPAPYQPPERQGRRSHEEPIDIPAEERPTRRRRPKKRRKPQPVIPPPENVPESPSIDTLVEPSLSPNYGAELANWENEKPEIKPDFEPRPATNRLPLEHKDSFPIHGASPIENAYDKAPYVPEIPEEPIPRVPHHEEVAIPREETLKLKEDVAFNRHPAGAPPTIPDHDEEYQPTARRSAEDNYRTPSRFAPPAAEVPSRQVSSVDDVRGSTSYRNPGREASRAVSNQGDNSRIPSRSPSFDGDRIPSTRRSRAREDSRNTVSQRSSAREDSRNLRAHSVPNNDDIRSIPNYRSPVREEPSTRENPRTSYRVPNDEDVSVVSNYRSPVREETPPRENTLPPHRVPNSDDVRVVPDYRPPIREEPPTRDNLLPTNRIPSTNNPRIIPEYESPHRDDAHIPTHRPIAHDDSVNVPSHRSSARDDSRSLHNPTSSSRDNSHVPSRRGSRYKPEEPREPVEVPNRSRTSSRYQPEEVSRHRSIPQYEPEEPVRTTSRRPQETYNSPRHQEPPPRHQEPPPRHQEPPSRYQEPSSRHQLPPSRHQEPPPRRQVSPPRHQEPPPRHESRNNPRPETRARETSTSRFSCPEPYGFFADHSQCDKYYECRNGTAYDGLCDDGLAFNEVSAPKYLRCDTLRDVDCSSRPKLQEPRGTKNCPRRFGLYPHESDCTKFWNCVDGSATEVQCPPGLVYNDDRATCDWADLVKSSCKTEDLVGFTCPEPTSFDLQDGVYTRYPHPSNCQLHFTCIKGEDGIRRPRMLSCNEGLVFDPSSTSCKRPEEVPGCEDFYGPITRRKPDRTRARDPEPLEEELDEPTPRPRRRGNSRRTRN